MKFSLWNQCINSFIPMKRMTLWCLIIKRKEIIMWIHVYPYWKMNFNSKNGRKKSFSYESKASISFIPMRRMNLWCPIIERKEIITWIQVYPIEKRTSILKMVEKEVLLLNPRQQNRLSQYEEWVYSAQSRKERRLLCESMFISMEIRTSILKIVEIEIVLMKPKH